MNYVEQTQYLSTRRTYKALILRNISFMAKKGLPQEVCVFCANVKAVHFVNKKYLKMSTNYIMEDDQIKNTLFWSDP
jgi:hypothetical protein